MSKRLPSTQRYLDIAEIRDDVLLMKDSSLRAVLATSSINFGLKSEDEQNAVVQSYVSFLNALDFPLEIVIQSRRLNIDKYLGVLEQIEREQTNDLLRLQIADYRQFIVELISIGQIMSKSFFVTVPYSGEGATALNQPKGFWSRIRDVASPTSVIRLKDDRFQAKRASLIQRVDHVLSGLSAMGLKVQQLNTQQLIEMLYTTYNPDVAEPQHLADVHSLNVEA